MSSFSFMHLSTNVGCTGIILSLWFLPSLTVIHPLSRSKSRILKSRSSETRIPLVYSILKKIGIVCALYGHSLGTDLLLSTAEKNLTSSSSVYICASYFCPCLVIPIGGTYASIPISTRCLANTLRELMRPPWFVCDS